MALVRFVLLAILAFVIMRFVARLIAELRSVRSGRRDSGPKSPRRRETRDIQDADFEDVTGENHDQKPQP